MNFFGVRPVESQPVKTDSGRRTNKGATIQRRALRYRKKLVTLPTSS